jgi:hypothetical protein
MRYLLALTLVACGAPATDAPAPQAAAPTTSTSGGVAPVAEPVASASSSVNVPDPEMPPFLPTPYTAEQIREACPKGRTLEFAVTEDGHPPRVKRMVFVAVTDAEATVESTTLDKSGKVLEGPERSTAAWDELRRHAEFPVAETTTRDARTTVKAGTFDCRVYEVKGDEGTLHTFHFARSLPGPPVLLEITRAGATTYRMELIRRAP